MTIRRPLGRTPELETNYAAAIQAGQESVIQSIILGPTSNQAKVCAYIAGDNEPAAVICLRKIRQWPVDFGVGTLMESIRDPELEGLGLRFFRGLPWRGTGSVEFKRDERDGGWKMIEMNPRLWQQTALADACGLNFPWIQYQVLRGQPPVLGAYRTGVRWLDEFRDPRSAWEHHRRGQLGLWQYLRSFRGVRILALFALDDPRPFLRALRRLAEALLRRFLRR
jgi:predicted ATP-grasp superfamily ATP-dependent carboligase